MTQHKPPPGAKVSSITTAKTGPQMTQEEFDRVVALTGELVATLVPYKGNKAIVLNALAGVTGTCLRDYFGHDTRLAMEMVGRFADIVAAGLINELTGPEGGDSVQ